MISVIPAIDILDGKCVRLTKGDFSTGRIYHDDPLELARQFEDAGFKRLHVVDLDGTQQKEIVNWKILEKIALHTSFIIDYGGGIRTDKDVDIAFSSGASLITAGSITIKNRELAISWLDRFGADKIILGSDVRKGEIAIEGWREASDYGIMKFLEDYQNLGFRITICTNVERDGCINGPDFTLYREIRDANPDLYIIASGGIGKIEDVYKLNEFGINAVIIGKAIYEKKIRLRELRSFL